MDFSFGLQPVWDVQTFHLDYRKKNDRSGHFSIFIAYAAGAQRGSNAAPL